MSDAPANPSAATPEVKQVEAPTPAETTAPKDTKTVPLAALHEAREENRALKAKLDAIEADTKAKAEAAAVEQGEFEKLYNGSKAELEASKATIETLTAKVDEFNEATEATIKKSLEGIPNEADRTLVSTLIEGKSATEKQALLPSLIEKFGQSKTINASVTGKQKAGVSTDTVQSVTEALNKAKADKASVVDIMRLETKLNKLRAG